MCLFFYFLRQHLPGGQIQLVPLFSREHDICCFCHIRQAFFIHVTDNGLDSGGVAENPGNGDAVWRGVVFLSQAVQDLVELRIFLASDEDSLEHTILEWRPGLNRDIFQAAVENVKETERVKNDAEYRLATGQMDNPAEMSIASSQWSMSVNLLIQLRNKALDAYNELMRISL